MSSQRMTDAERTRLVESLLLPSERPRVVQYIRLGYSAKRIASLMAVPERAVEAVKAGIEA